MAGTKYHKSYAIDEVPCLHQIICNTQKHREFADALGTFLVISIDYLRQRD